MNAMPAEDLTCDSGIRLERGDTAVIPRAGDAAITPLRAPHPDAPTPRASDSASLRPTLPSAGLRPGVPAAPLRLTRRGRVVVAALAALLVAVISMLVAGAALATNHAPSPGAERRSLVQVVVQPGQSLWSVAESADPDQDTRVVIQQIVDLNGLSSDVVFAGQQLWVPRS